MNVFPHLYFTYLDGSTIIILLLFKYLSYQLFYCVLTVHNHCLKRLNVNTTLLALIDLNTDYTCYRTK